MKYEIAMKWVEALRSGNYKQGHFGLRYTNDKIDEFCCLGVLCDISGQGEWHKDNFLINDSSFQQYERKAGLLPNKVMEWAGIQTPDCKIYKDSLIALNDNKDYSFDQIAHYIEKNWKEL
jgi:hypothetical protein